MILGKQYQVGSGWHKRAPFASMPDKTQPEKRKLYFQYLGFSERIIDLCACGAPATEWQPVTGLPKCAKCLEVL